MAIRLTYSGYDHCVIPVSYEVNNEITFLIIWSLIVFAGYKTLKSDKLITISLFFIALIYLLKITLSAYSIYVIHDVHFINYNHQLKVIIILPLIVLVVYRKSKQILPATFLNGLKSLFIFNLMSIHVLIFH